MGTDFTGRNPYFLPYLDTPDPRLRIWISASGRVKSLLSRRQLLQHNTRAGLKIQEISFTISWSLSLCLATLDSVLRKEAVKLLPETLGTTAIFSRYKGVRWGLQLRNRPRANTTAGTVESFPNRYRCIQPGLPQLFNSTFQRRTAPGQDNRTKGMAGSKNPLRNYKYLNHNYKNMIRLPVPRGCTPNNI